MKSLNSRALLALISFLILVCVLQAAAQTVQSVRVVNTTKNPVPTVALQGTTTFKYDYVLAYQCTPPALPTDLCVYGKYNPNNQIVLASDVLTTLGSQGFDLVTVASISNPPFGNGNGLAFTLRKPSR